TASRAAGSPTSRTSPSWSAETSGDAANPPRPGAHKLCALPRPHVRRNSPETAGDFPAFPRENLRENPREIPSKRVENRRDLENFPPFLTGRGTAKILDDRAHIQVEGRERVRVFSIGENTNRPPSSAAGRGDVVRGGSGLFFWAIGVGHD